ncbi:serine/threonine protein kinase [Nannocystis exedens]|nr:serine/threonine-protein kinase [Nannocystis exedens]
MLATVVTGTSEARARVGDVLGGRWELREPVGGGGLGRVFLAWDRERRQTCALKLFDASATSSEAFRRYTEAIRTAAAVSHPAVVLPQTPVVAGGPRFAVAEWLAGADLDGLRARGEPLQWARAAEIVSTCADALAVVHEATGLAHRALKPGNVWITESSQVRLLDLGIAELAVSPVAPRDGGVFVDYRAPEQIEGNGGDARADVFTLAVLLFELTTGVHPFAGASAFKAAHRVLQATPDLSTAGLPLQARSLLTRALARRPDERHASAREFLRALTLVRQSVGSMAPRPTAADIAHTAETVDEPAPTVDPTTQLRIPVARPKPPIAAPEAGARDPHKDAAFVAPVAPATADSPPAADEPALLGSGAERPTPARPSATGKPAHEPLPHLSTGPIVTPEPSTERDARRPTGPELTMALREPARVSRRPGPAGRDPKPAPAPKGGKSRPEANFVPAPPELPADWITTERDFRRPAPPREATVALPLPADLSKKPGVPATGRDGRRRAPPEKTARRPRSDEPSKQPGLPADWTTFARDGRRPAPETTLALPRAGGLAEQPGLPADWTTTERDGRRPAPEATMALPDPARAPERRAPADEDAATTAMPTLKPRPSQSVPEDTFEEANDDEVTRAIPRITALGHSDLHEGPDGQPGRRPESTVVLDRGGARPAESTLALPDPKDIPDRGPRDARPAAVPAETTQVVSNLGEQARAAMTRRPAGAAEPRAPAADKPSPGENPWLSPRRLILFNIALGVLILAALAVVLTR